MSEWYGVRCLFEHRLPDLAAGQRLYEERVVLLRASSPDEAIARAEAEARDYAGTDGDSPYLDFCQAYHLFEAPSDAPTEVFSLLRESGLEPSAYIDRFFATGAEREQTV